MSVAGIDEHRDALKALRAEAGAEVAKAHCRGMEGLAAEALKHAVEEGPDDGTLRDIAILAQHQRMSHYGIAGFGTAAAYAKALGLKDHQAKLKDIVADIYEADEYATKLAKKAEKRAA